MNLLDKIENAKKELSRRPMDYNEKLSINGVDIEKSEDKINCIIKYTIIIGNDCDESWGSIIMIIFYNKNRKIYILWRT